MLLRISHIFSQCTRLVSSLAIHSSPFLIDNDRQSQRVYRICSRLLNTSCTRHNRDLWRVDTKNPFLVIPEAWEISLSDSVEEKKSIINLHPGMFFLFC